MLNRLNDTSQFSGVLLIDKPLNKISHELTSIIAKWFNTKAGHAGTLDPNVSGVLPIAIGKARKFLRFIAEKDKTYVGLVAFRNKLKAENVEKLFKKFEGVITQTPPKISAVAKKPRKRKIYRLKLLEIKENMALFYAHVEKGTYIRTLCEDMGGKMVDLRRIRVGNIGEKDCITAQKLFVLLECYKRGLSQELLNYIHPIENFLNYPKIYLTKKAALNLSNGSPLAKGGIIKVEGNFNKGNLIGLFYEDIFLGIGKALYDFDNMPEKTYVIHPYRIYRTKREFLYALKLQKPLRHIIFPK